MAHGSIVTSTLLHSIGLLPRRFFTYLVSFNSICATTSAPLFLNPLALHLFLPQLSLQQAMIRTTQKLLARCTDLGRGIVKPNTAKARPAALVLRGASTSASRPVAVSPSAARSVDPLGPQLLSGIEERWEEIHPQEQAEVWMNLRDRMKGNWKELSASERKAGETSHHIYPNFLFPSLSEIQVSLTLGFIAYWVSFGPHGPRTLPPPGEWKKVLAYTLSAIGLTWILFLSRELGARPAPKTMTPEWQAKTNERLQAQRTEPITGISSEHPDRKGKGMVQSDTGIVGWDVGVKGYGEGRGNRDGRGIALREAENEQERKRFE